MSAGNGVGPSWLWTPARDFLTRVFSFYFIEASHEKHDEGYKVGSPSWAECDRKFLQAMLRDASLATTTFRTFICTFLAWLLWLLCRLGGWMSYNFKGKKDV